MHTQAALTGNALPTEKAGPLRHLLSLGTPPMSHRHAAPPAAKMDAAECDEVQRFSDTGPYGRSAVEPQGLGATEYRCQDALSKHLQHTEGSCLHVESKANTVQQVCLGLDTAETDERRKHQCWPARGAPAEQTKVEAGRSQ